MNIIKCGEMGGSQSLGVKSEVEISKAGGVRGWARDLACSGGCLNQIDLPCDID